MGIHVGTSGWHYKHWLGPFYPGKMPSDEFLRYYAERLCTVEINNSFYKLPEKSAFAMWRDTAPDGFLFAVKASRFITHMKKLKDPQQSFQKFFERVIHLGDKLGPVLFQLPPKWGPDIGRLDQFLQSLPKGLRYAFELRDPSWFIPELEQVLTRYNAAFCIYEFDRRLSPKIVTADFVYVRLHGPEGRYQGSYPDDALAEWAAEFRRWRRGGKDVFCYFDNDQAGFAAQNAMTLDRMVRRAKRLHA